MVCRSLVPLFVRKRAKESRIYISGWSPVGIARRREAEDKARRGMKNTARIVSYPVSRIVDRVKCLGGRDTTCTNFSECIAQRLHVLVHAFQPSIIIHVASFHNNM